MRNRLKYKMSLIGNLQKVIIMKKGLYKMLKLYAGLTMGISTEFVSTIYTRRSETVGYALYGKRRTI